MSTLTCPTPVAPETCDHNFDAVSYLGNSRWRFACTRCGRAESIPGPNNSPCHHHPLESIESYPAPNGGCYSFCCCCECWLD